MNCHMPQGETPFDASILGAHVVPTDTAAMYPQNPDTLLAGINLAITSVTNTKAGQTPTVDFTLQETMATISLSQHDHPDFHHGRSDHRLWPHQFRERHRQHSRLCDGERYRADLYSSGACTYTFTHAIPAGATGTYSIGGESRTTVTVLAGTTSSQSVEYWRQESGGQLLGGRLDGDAAAHRGRAQQLQ